MYNNYNVYGIYNSCPLTTHSYRATMQPFTHTHTRASHTQSYTLHFLSDFFSYSIKSLKCANANGALPNSHGYLKRVAGRTRGGVRVGRGRRPKGIWKRYGCRTFLLFCGGRGEGRWPWKGVGWREIGEAGRPAAGADMGGTPGARTPSTRPTWPGLHPTWPIMWKIQLMWVKNYDAASVKSVTDKGAIREGPGRACMYGGGGVLYARGGRVAWWVKSIRGGAINI